MTEPTDQATPEWPNHRLTDEEWAQLQRFMPAPRPRRGGRPPIPDRIVCEAALWIGLYRRTWSQPPADFPKENSVRNKLNLWADLGVLQAILEALPELELRRPVRRSLVRAFQPFIDDAADAQSRALSPNPGRDEAGTSPGRGPIPVPQDSATGASRRTEIPPAQNRLSASGHDRPPGHEASGHDDQDGETAPAPSKPDRMRDLGEASVKAAGRRRRTTLRISKDGVSISMPEVFPVAAVLNDAPPKFREKAGMAMLAVIIFTLLLVAIEKVRGMLD